RRLRPCVPRCDANLHETTARELRDERPCRPRSAEALAISGHHVVGNGLGLVPLSKRIPQAEREGSQGIAYRLADLAQAELRDVEADPGSEVSDAVPALDVGPRPDQVMLHEHLRHPLVDVEGNIERRIGGRALAIAGDECGEGLNDL